MTKWKWRTCKYCKTDFHAKEGIFCSIRCKNMWYNTKIFKIQCPYCSEKINMKSQRSRMGFPDTKPYENKANKQNKARKRAR